MQDDINILEAITVLQAENAGFIDGAKRPNGFNDLNLDFKISWANESKFPDIKAPLDPEIIRSRNEPYLSFEDQVDKILKNISFQCQRATNSGESLIHSITLLRIKLSDRAYFIWRISRKKLESKT